jgi:hypothetical protein
MAAFMVASMPAADAGWLVKVSNTATSIKPWYFQTPSPLFDDLADRLQ